MVRVRALGDQVTVYDEEGNVIERIPDRPEPKFKYVNIIEIEDRIMGIDPDAKPDFFIDFETDERFFDVNDDPKYDKLDAESILYFSLKHVIFTSLIIFAFLFGYYNMIDISVFFK